MQYPRPTKNDENEKPVNFYDILEIISRLIDNSEFNEYMDSISAMDADVISIECSRAGEALLNIFREKGINSVVVGMADHNMHTLSEYVTISELISAAKLCEILIKK